MRSGTVGPSSPRTRRPEAMRAVVTRVKSTRIGGSEILKQWQSWWLSCRGSSRDAAHGVSGGRGEERYKAFSYLLSQGDRRIEKDRARRVLTYKSMH